MSRLTDTLDLRVPIGGSALLQGPNGSGKTCALALLMGLLRMRGGTAKFGGVDLSVARRGGAVVGFGPTLRPPPGATFRRWSVTRAPCFSISSRRLQASAERWEVIEYWDEPVDRLSAGMQWRCALAFAFATDGALICLDEPDANLDRMGQQLLVSELLTTVADTGGVAVVASHHLVAPFSSPICELPVEWCRRKAVFAP